MDQKRLTTKPTQLNGAGAGRSPIWRRLLLILLVLSLTTNTRAIGASAATSPVGVPLVPILVKFTSAATPQQKDNAIRAGGGTAVRELSQIRSRVINVPAGARDQILAAYGLLPVVERAAAAIKVAKTDGPNDAGYAQQWALPKIAWDTAYATVPIAGSAKIAVLDTGVDATHPDLAGRIAAGQSFTGGVANVDPNGHGTALAGIAAASVNNTLGMAGVAYAGASLSSVQVLQADGTGWDSDVVSGVLWAADNGAKVILMGFSSAGYSAALADALAYAWTKGAVLVAATGNDGSSGASYPAGMANVIGVAATDQTDAVAAGSNTGSASVAAPGVGIYATQVGGGYGTTSGTSASAALTAGLAALLVASGRSNGDASAQIRGATDPVAGATFGRINVAKALGAGVPAPSPTTSPTPTPTPTTNPTYTAAARAFAISASPTTVTEGNTGTTTVTFTVTLSGTGSGNAPWTVDYATTGGNATGGSTCGPATIDYTSKSGTLTFTAHASQTVNVSVCGDTIDELNETFSMALSNPSGSANLGTSSATVTITDDDPTPTLSINDVTVTEGNSGTTSATFTVSLSAASGQTVTVSYATANGTATAPSDYVAITATTLTFAPGDTSKTVSVSVNGDIVVEPNETFFVNLASPTNATISDSQGQGTITNDDNTPPVAVADAYSTSEDTTLSVAAPGVLANDTDVDSGTTLTAVLVAGPTKGSLTLNLDGSFSYIPNANANGADSFTYKASDGTAQSNIATVTITVAAVNDAPVAVAAAATTAEDTAVSITLSASDIDSATLSFSIVTGPTSGGLGTISAASCTSAGPGSSCTATVTYTPNLNFNGSDSFTYKANDGSLNSNTATATITVTAVNDAPVAVNDAYSTNEDTTLTVAAPGVLANDADVDGDALTAVLVAGPSHGTLTLNTNGSFSYAPAANYHGPDSFTYKASDGTAQSNTATVTITVTPVNDPTTVGPIVGPLAPVQKDTTVNVSATFSDVDLGDTHTATWTWDDGSTPTTCTAASSSASCTLTEPTSTGAGSVRATHTYTTPGVYEITVTVCDLAGSCASSTFQYVVIYDPQGGFVTGGGWINSPLGAYALDPTLSGKANFGFVSKYQKGATVPTGHTEFQFHAASFKFASTSYEWLTIAGARAQYKGSGTVNGSGNYGFLLSATDGQVSGGGGVDKFRIKIWDRATGVIVYDNQRGADDDAPPATGLGGGSIVIHGK